MSAGDEVARRWRQALAASLPPGAAPQAVTGSGVELDPLLPVAGDDGRIGWPGEFPFTRGPYASMYRGRPWTMRQYGGFGDAQETNARFRFLLARGQTGLSVAFDLPTQMGHDPDAALAAVPSPGPRSPRTGPRSRRWRGLQRRR